MPPTAPDVAFTGEERNEVVMARSRDGINDCVNFRGRVAGAVCTLRNEGSLSGRLMAPRQRRLQGRISAKTSPTEGVPGCREGASPRHPHPMRLTGL
jgi:hypothetical protein